MMTIDATAEPDDLPDPAVQPDIIDPAGLDDAADCANISDDDGAPYVLDNDVVEDLLNPWWTISGVSSWGSWASAHEDAWDWRRPHWEIVVNFIKPKTQMRKWSRNAQIMQDSPKTTVVRPLGGPCGF